jgi:hypothetical protein
MIDLPRFDELFEHMDSDSGWEYRLQAEQSGASTFRLKAVLRTGVTM